jgi:ribosomal protein S18 acetylase RimI-like enzyme
MPEPAYRQATPTDAEAIANVGAAVWDELGEQSGLIGRATAEAIRGRMEELGQRGAFFLCQSEPEKTCGFAIVQPDVSHPQEAVLGVWLVKDARGKGIGRELAVAATEFARAAGYKRLRGIIPENNEPALAFFGDFGSIAQIVGQGMEYELPL